MDISFNENDIIISLSNDINNISDTVDYIVNLSSSIKSMVYCIHISNDPFIICKSILMCVNMLHAIQKEIMNTPGIIVSPGTIVLCYDVNKIVIKAIDNIVKYSRTDIDINKFIRKINIMNDKWVKRMTKRIGDLKK